MRLSTVLALVLLSSTAAASAQEITTYAGLRGSLAFDGSIKANANLAPPVNLKTDLNVGGGASVFWGVDLPAGFDAELELMYRYMPLGDGVVNGTAAKFGGYGQMLAPMANVYWTAPVDFPVKPYIGAGLGYAWNEVGINSIGTTTFQTVHDDNWRFAYNLMAGVSIPASEGSRFTIGYRWLHEDIGINCGTGVNCSGSLNSSSIDVGYVINL
jgi:opacity protein-like surface antigen